MYQVGQKLFVAMGRGNGKSREMTITKIGRKWLELDGGRYRAAIDGLSIDGNGYSSPGQAYISEAAYSEWSEAQSAWFFFYKPSPAHIHKARIRNCREDQAGARAFGALSRLPLPGDSHEERRHAGESAP